jgi:hypothetical protein
MLDRLVFENETNIRQTKQKIEFVLDDYSTRTRLAHNNYLHALSELEHAKRNFDYVPDFYFRAVSQAEAEYNWLSNCCNKIRSIGSNFNHQSGSIKRTLMQEVELYSAILKKGVAFIEKYTLALTRSREAITGHTGEAIGKKDIPDRYGSSFNDRIKQTPISGGKWDGERGNSKWKPGNESIIRELGDYGIDGINYQDGFPDFTPIQVFECKLPNKLYEGKDNAQFSECNFALLDHLKDHHECVSNFDDTQLGLIASGYNPSGYTWHHDVKEGRMQLVSTPIHNSCGHYGGKNVWGGGTANR